MIWVGWTNEVYSFVVITNCLKWSWSNVTIIVSLVHEDEAATTLSTTSLWLLAYTKHVQLKLVSWRILHILIWFILNISTLFFSWFCTFFHFVWIWSIFLDMVEFWLNLHLNITHLGNISFKSCIILNRASLRHQNHSTVPLSLALW